MKNRKLIAENCEKLEKFLKIRHVMTQEKLNFCTINNAKT